MHSAMLPMISRNPATEHIAAATKIVFLWSEFELPDGGVLVASIDGAIVGVFDGASDG